MMLIITLYAIVTIISIFGGYLPKFFVEKKGMHPYSGRMLSMLIFAFFPLFALFAQPMGQFSAWWPAIMFLGYVVDKLHDKYGLTYTGTTEQTNLPPFGIRFKQVDNLDTGKQHFL